ncbi:alpha/beta hydrolase family protein [Nocardia sp. CDC160]|uniref:alpha/beta hydrolase family protein n=1 Tax=Nocardia sp. CDC160 TaxID=3112166 RepID=UPI002DBEA2A1|nr:hypothetical protein [Nocardia sp. CDC160]MEC3918312.1 hypothetical protein [Nocardia sp. CDC160]
MLLRGKVIALAAVLPIALGSVGSVAAEPVSQSAGLRVGVTTLHLVDAGRPDPWQPSTPRELVVTIHYPAVHAEGYPVADRLLPGIPSTVLAARAHVDAPTEAGALPVLLYSPAASFPAQAGATLAEDLADSGYAVVSISDTHGTAPATVFPDGHVELYDPRNVTEPLDDVLRIASAARAGDIGFVLDKLATMARGDTRDADGKQLPAGVGAALDLSKVGMYGHSLGGTMTVFADQRIQAGVDLDGYAPPSYLAPGLVAAPERPMLFLFGNTPDPDVRRTSVDSMLAGRTGWTRELALSGAGHWAFSDLVYLPRQLAESPILSAYLGTIAPDRAHAIIRAYVTAMFDRFLRGRPAPLLDANPSEFPEVTAA